MNLVPEKPCRPRAGDSEEDCSTRAHQKMGNFGKLFRAGKVNTYQEFVFKHVEVRAKRAALLTALEEAEGIPASMLWRIQRCASMTFLYRDNESGVVRHRTMMCGSRWCPVCGPTFIFRMKVALFDHIPDPAERLTFCTLTRRVIEGQPLRDAARSLLKAFLALRRTPLWRRHVVGGLYVLEFKESVKYRDSYNVHLHLVIDAKFIPVHLLAAEWERVSGSTGVHMSVVKLREDLHRYLAKYLSKPMDSGIYRKPHLLREALTALRGRPMLMTFGGWRGAALTRSAEKDRRRKAGPTPYTNERWTFLGDLETVISRCGRGDLPAKAVLAEAGFGEWTGTLFETGELAVYNHSPPEGELGCRKIPIESCQRKLPFTGERLEVSRRRHAA